jgi:hypothetical protein
VAKKGAICPIFEGNMPLLKRTPFSCRIYAALAGVLLKETNSTGDDTVAIRLGRNPMVEKVEYKRKDE